MSAKTSIPNPSKVVPQGPRRSRADGSAKNLLQSVTVERVASPVFQIADRMRDMISDGGLIPGMRLPSTRELSDQLGVDPSSVHRALSILVKEGLLVRTPYVGTFVADRVSSKLERLAFYHLTGPGHSLSAFGRALLEEVTRLGHEQDFHVEVFNDTRTNAEMELTPPDDLERKARTRHIQGVISPYVSPERYKWMDGLPVPFATISTLKHANSYNWERQELSAAAVRCLAQRGCRRIGMISALLAHPFPGADSYQLGLYTGFVRGAKEVNLEVNQARLIGVPNPTYKLSDSNFPAYGFEAFSRIWDSLPESERPDGLFVYPDAIAVGVLMALSMRNVRVPEDLKLVIHHNEEVPVFSPYPVDRLVVKVADAAEALVNHIRNRLLSRPIGDRVLPAYLQPSPELPPLEQ
jgi:DNA-binding LacI/PurR family transcriptional regulator